MDTATLALPVVVLVLLAVLVALPGGRTSDARPAGDRTRAPHVPQSRLDGVESGEPLPPDQRAHLSWVADHTASDDVRAEVLHRLSVDDRRRGLDHLRRA